jgi:hypothetical protein
MSDATNDMQQLRQQVDEILARAKADQEYRRQLIEAPQDTLEAAGLPGWAVDQLVFNEWDLADVNGYTKKLREYTEAPCGTTPAPAPPPPCDTTTCWFGVSLLPCIFSNL